MQTYAKVQVIAWLSCAETDHLADSARLTKLPLIVAVADAARCGARLGMAATASRTCCG